MKHRSSCYNHQFQLWPSHQCIQVLDIMVIHAVETSSHGACKTCQEILQEESIFPNSSVGQTYQIIHITKNFKQILKNTQKQISIEKQSTQNLLHYYSNPCITCFVNIFQSCGTYLTQVYVGQN